MPYSPQYKHSSDEELILRALVDDGIIGWREHHKDIENMIDKYFSCEMILAKDNLSSNVNDLNNRMHRIKKRLLEILTHR